MNYRSGMSFWQSTYTEEAYWAKPALTLFWPESTQPECKRIARH